MAVGYVVPNGKAQDIDTLATALAAEVNISAAVQVRDVPEVDNNVEAVKVTGTAEVDITNAIAAMTGTAGVALVFQFHHGGATSGNNTISIGGQTTANIAFNATNTAVDTAITALSTVTACTVTGSGTAADPYVVTITEVGDKGDVSVNVVDSNAQPQLQVNVQGEDAVVGALLLPGTTIA